MRRSHLILVKQIPACSTLPVFIKARIALLQRQKRIRLVWLISMPSKSIRDCVTSRSCLDGKALRLEPKYLEAYCNKANSLLAIGQHEKANITFQKALSLNSSDADTLYNLSYLQLAEGNFKEGWKNYEYRWLRQNAPKKPFNAIPPLTSLENLKNKNILIWAEQGLGYLVV